MKRSIKKWLTPIIRWQTEKQKLSYDHVWRSFKRKKKKISQKVFAE